MENVGTTFTLRDYQRDASFNAYTHLIYDHTPANGLIVLPTASGKSLVIADICHKLNQPVLILQPSKELLEQNYAKLEGYGVTDIAIFSASKKTKEIARFTYATIGSIIRRPDDFKHFRFVIIDEAHLVAPGGQYTKFLRAIGSPRVVGLTATPVRLVTAVTTHTDGKRYSRSWLSLITARGQFFDTILYSRSVAELTRDGYLAKATYHRGNVSGLHSLKVNSSGTEFTNHSVEHYWSESAAARLCAWLQTLEHERVLVFVPTLEMAAALTPGLGVDMIDGTMPEKGREMVLERFRRGQTHILVNVGVLTTGYDLPSLDAVVLARPTMSLGLYMQMVGRVLRIDPERPDKKAYVYDFGGNVGRFGPVENVRITNEGIWAGDRQITGQVISEVCVSDIMRRRRERVPA